MQRLLTRAGAVEQVCAAVQALVARDHDIAEQVFCGDEPINQLHVEIDERCFQLPLLHQLDASDLRVDFFGVKINSDLERVDDFALNIVEATLRKFEHPTVRPFIDIPRMESIDRECFVIRLMPMSGKILL